MATTKVVAVIAGSGNNNSGWGALRQRSYLCTAAWASCGTQQPHNRNKQKKKTTKKENTKEKQSENIFVDGKNFRCLLLLRCEFPHKRTRPTIVQQVVLGSLWHAAWSNAF